MLLIPPLTSLGQNACHKQLKEEGFIWAHGFMVLSPHSGAKHHGRRNTGQQRFSPHGRQEAGRGKGGGEVHTGKGQDKT